ncbi:MAG: tetratricopeptide repeat protein [Pseudomonadota bacterium]
MPLISELQRRNVFRVAAAYLVVGWLLTELLTAVLPTLGAPGWVPNAVIWVFALGFVPTLILSWVFELTPEGLRTQESLDSEGHRRRRQVSKLDYLTIAGIFLIVVLAGFFSATRTTEAPNTLLGDVLPQSVAVLPFVNLSNDPDNEYFSNGLTETLLHRLAQSPELKVAARTSSFAFKGKNIDIREIAGTLEVAHILEGSVQQAGNTVRITAQLIRADDGFHVWSESYDRTMDDIFGIQDEIATRVGQALSATLLGGAVAPAVEQGTPNTTAYDLYLLARNERVNYSYGSLEASEKYLKAALRADPQYLNAKSELASNYLYQQETGLMATEDAFAMAGALTQQVLDVLPEDPLSRAVEYYLAGMPDGSEREPAAVFEAIEGLEALVAEYPDEYEVRSLLSRLLVAVQRYDRALELELEALARDPLNARILYEVGGLYLNLGEFDEARSALNRSLEYEPNQPNAHLRLGTIALRTGDGVEFMRQQLEAMRDDPRDYELPGFIAMFLYRLDLVAEGDDFRNLVVTEAPTSDLAYLLDLLRAKATADEDAGMAAARRAIEDDIGNRSFAYASAVEYLLTAARRAGTLDEEMLWLEQQAPDILNVDAAVVPTKYRAAQLVAVDAWYVSLSEDEFMRRIERLSELARSFGVDPLADPKVRLSALALEGETQKAVELALAEVFAQPVTINLDYWDKLAQAHFAEIVADPGVQAAVERWKAEKSELRRSVARFLAEFGEADQDLS